MYPRTYYETFLRYEPSYDVFVAMPFTAEFQKAFESTIAPAVQNIQINGKPLTPRIINAGTSGSPDIHEQIHDAIIHSRVVIADMTVQTSCKMYDGTERWQANANVAYEVGLAAAWRNPEDILLIHQSHPNHRYSFDVQNLRHITYRPGDIASIQAISNEIVSAINQSRFLAERSFQKLLESVSPVSVQLMHEEARRAFPVIAFGQGMGSFTDARVEAISELQKCGALAARNILPPTEKTGVNLVFRWTQLGLKMLQAYRALSPERAQQLQLEIDSVPADTIPPKHLIEFPEQKQSPQRDANESQPENTSNPHQQSTQQGTTSLDSN